MNQAAPAREFRRVPRQIFPAGGSIHSDSTPPPPLPALYNPGHQEQVQGYDAAQYNSQPFIDDRSYPDQGTTSLPIPLHGYEQYQHISRDVSQFQNRLATLGNTVDYLVQNSRFPGV